MRCVTKNYGTLNVVDMLLRKLHITEFWLSEFRYGFARNFKSQNLQATGLTDSTLENAQDTDAQLMGYMDEEKERLVTWA